MGEKTRKGAVIGLVLAVVIILSQPFHPIKGLIPELVTFLTTVPIWLATMIYPAGVPAIVEAGMIVIYFILMGALIGASFEYKKLWGWLLLITLIIHHYIIYDRIGRGMSELVQGLLNSFK